MSETETTEAPERSVPVLGEDVHDTADRIVRRYPVSRSALLPLLHLVQSVQNHITDEGIAFCAEKVGLTRAEVGAVATFYTMYKRQPVGDWLLSVCTNPVCKQAGGQEIYEGYLESLGGHSDAETKVTVEHAECLGICDGAPVVQVNYEMFGPMTVAEGAQLLADCRKGEPPVSPWSGEKPPTFAEIERDLSGANDAWESELHEAALQQIAFAEPPTYRTGETDLPVTHPGGDPAGVGGAAFRAAAAGGSNGDGTTALGQPEVAVDPDASDPTPMAGTVAQRIGEETMGDVESATPGTPADGEVDVAVEEATAQVGHVPGDAEALTTEAVADSSALAGDARGSASATIEPPPEDRGDAADQDPEQGSGEAGDRAEAEATGGGEDDAPTASGEDAPTGASAPAPRAQVTDGESEAVPGSVPSGPVTEELRRDAAAVEVDDDGTRVRPDEDDGADDEQEA